jgi:hypothetical protein
MSYVVLHSDNLTVEIDAGFGGDITRVLGARHDELMLRTPWATHARAVREGRSRPSPGDNTSSWLECYEGGWQGIFPNPGPPSARTGTSVGFHGSSTTSTWEVVHADEGSVTLTTALFVAPIVAERTIALVEDTITWTDRLSNTSSSPVPFDYLSHPAFGSALLDGEFSVGADAARFVVVDAEEASGLNSGDYLEVPMSPPLRTGSASAYARRYGWLEGFTEGVIEIRSQRLNLALRWDPDVLPFVWWWQETEEQSAFPWFGRCRTLAFEPSTRPPLASADPGCTIPPCGLRVFSVQVRIEESLD